MTESPLTLTEAERTALAARTTQVCVVYRDHPMPSGTVPGTARIGIESSGPGARLYVHRGLAYTGSDEEIRRWLLDGVRRFESLDDLLSWLGRAVGPIGARPAAHRGASRPGPGSRPVVPAPANVTELDEVEAPADAAAPPTAEDLLELLRARVLGQDAALAALASAVAQHARKSFPRRPLSAMLVGPTGVGKTETAETLARTLSELGHGDWHALRLDMAEMSERFAVSRLVGAPPGYIGYGDDSLASHLARHPRQVVLFDEVDRAHPDVVTALMNLVDAGRLDSARYGAVTARQAILLFTTNLGAAELPVIHDGDGDRLGRDHLLRHGMAPELVARFGTVAVYGPLTASALAAVAARAVGTVAADYGVAVRHVAPAYLSRLLGRTTGSGLGVRAIEHAADAELGRGFAAQRGGYVVVADDGAVVPDDVPAAGGGPAGPNADGSAARDASAPADLEVRP